MSEVRLGPAGLAIKQDLPGRAGHQVVAPNDLVHAHRMIIGDDGELIGEASVVSRDNEIAAQVRGVDGDAAEEDIIPLDQSLRHAKPPGEWAVAKLRRIGDAAIGTCTRISWPFVARVRSARCPGGVGTRARAGVNAFALLQAFEHLVIKCAALRLEIGSGRAPEIRPLIPIKSQPSQVLDRRLRCPGAST